ncbi:SH2 domain-containing protein 3C isoform X2 [Polypterus senegalus]|uniref:SH2 domain-containing protein 3C isoform X2 n=1 Tax=Polypterus senegalus TaxID=55291 RepID=UPI001963CF75|nr:SH2 domain-containing protein 3C isoform X2 [Polypterus senegalus]
MSLKKLGIKWFGSLSNISFRRSSSSSDSKTQDHQLLKHHGSLPEDTTFEKSVDDMGTSPKSPTYARSSDMYSHMGTMPRHDKSSKGSKKAKAKADLNRKQSQQLCSDSVPESVLLSALSGSIGQSQEATARDCEKQESSHNAGKAQQSNSLPELKNKKSELVYPNELKGPALPERNKPTRTTHEHPPPQEPTKGDPVKGAEQTSLDKMSSPLEVLQGTTSDMTLNEAELSEGQEQEMNPNESHLDNMDSRGEYVKFSKEKYLLDPPPEKLKRELEEELKLSSSDLRSHGWYHGRIPREVSETLVLRNGDFLIRDSLTSTGDYVLTSRWNNEVLHFKINKVLVKTNDSYSRVQYLLEREGFDSVPALVHYYVGNRNPVSQQSGAHIYSPVNRTLPLRYLEASFTMANSKHGLSQSPGSQRGGYIKRRSVTMTDGLTTEKIIPHSPSNPHHKEAIRNCALSMDQIQDFHCSMSPVSEGPPSPAYSTVMRHKSPAVGRVAAMVPSSPVMRRSSEPQLCPSTNNNTPCSEAQHSTHSTPAHKYCQSPVVKKNYDTSETEATGGHYCELRLPPSTPGPLPAKSYVERLRVEELGKISEKVLHPASTPEEYGEESFIVPVIETTSAFKPSSYVSMLMPAENKPLEMSILKKVKELLAEVDAKTTAKHITKADCMVARILGVSQDLQKTMGVSSGLELITLPHGHQLRMDLLERFHTMSIMMAVDLLGCTGSTEERAALLHKTIQLAAELKSNLGNMFGFAAVMKALEMPQISRLDQTWMTLRQRHTEGAILYEKKLKPFMKNMNDGKESCPLSNTSFPHVIPLLSLLEKGVAIAEGLEPWENADAGVDVVMNHLEAARTIAHHGGIYQTNAETKLQGFQEREEVLEIFQTEFQMRLLWGSRGAEGKQAERYEKFDKVLTALSHKLEPPVRQSEL